MSPNLLTEKQIATKLAALKRETPINPFPQDLLDGPTQPAAVLIPLFREAGGWHVLFVRRTESIHDPHSGQVAFPGGRCDPQDPAPETAALREAQEEIGLDPKDVHILGRLQDLVTISNYQVTPIVAAIPWPYPLRPSPEEVARIFTIPLSWLADPINRETLERKVPNYTTPFSEIYFKRYADELLWGVSARIMVDLLTALNLT